MIKIKIEVLNFTTKKKMVIDSQISLLSETPTKKEIVSLIEKSAKKAGEAIQDLSYKEIIDSLL